MLKGILTTENTINGTLSGGFVEPTLTTKNITENGTYNASSDNVDGYSQVNVDVEPTLTTKNITENGTYNASSDNVDGYSQVNVDVEPTLATKNITENGTYNASSDNVDGYSQVNVDVEPTLTTKNITENGTYNASSDNADGYSQVNVNVSGGGDVPTIYDLTPNTKINSRWGYYFEIGNTVFVTFNFSVPINTVIGVNETLYSGLPLPDPAYNIRFNAISYRASATNVISKIDGASGNLSLESAITQSNSVTYAYGSFFYKKAVTT